MPCSWRSLRRRLLTRIPDGMVAVRRGPGLVDTTSRSVFEMVDRTVRAGFDAALDSSSVGELETRLDRTARDFRGFAYEGAASAYAMLDAVSPTRTRRVGRLLTGRGAAHRYLIYFGVGRAIGRLPRFRWRSVLPADPMLHWLAVDGLGFHRAILDPVRYVRQQHRADVAGWPYGDFRHYLNRALDQGTGRALWFVEGADVDRVVATVGRFPAQRHDDLLSGVGFAATYTSGVSESALRRLWRLSGEHRSFLAQGAAFAAQARHRAGLVNAHTRTAAAVLCGTSVEQATDIAERSEVGLAPDGALPGFGVWRQRVADRFTSRGRR
ncbi:DUF1702 family protein [Solwaraspora sp. WMMD406]|uniref:DUF1702 family protein n=1 Tax=Solwaraspora sp. WMMD406 TaxID=3016095 RepID=UPI0024159CD1|nr:DUF1702 family protein [Solwaraspora sp. WMMD406]MDG4763981.1 DUF1702 family protein [Solwaraspora sp. WMMD406]